MAEIQIESTATGEWLHLRLGRANAIGPAFLQSLGAALDQLPKLDLESPTRPVLLTGEGSVLSAGLDLPTLMELDRDGMRRFLEQFDDVFGRFACLDRPTIAVVNGHAVAGGAVLVLACDYRIGATALPSGKPYGIGLKESVLGIPVPGVVADIVRSALGGSPWLFEILLTGDLFSPEEALARGLLHRLVPAPELQDVANAESARFAQATTRAALELRRSLKPDLWNRRRMQPSEDVFLEAWFSAAARARIGAVVDSLRR